MAAAPSYAYVPSSYFGGLGGGSAYAPPGFSSAATSGGHGGFGHGLASDLEHMATGIIPGLLTLGSAAGSDLIHHSILSAFVNAAKGNAAEARADLNPLTGQLGKKIIVPLAKSEYDYYRHFGSNIRHGHITTPIIDALTLLSLGGGRIAALSLTPKELGQAARTKALLTGKYGGDIRKIEAVMPSGKVQTIRELPRSGYRAKKALVVEAGKRKAFGTSGRTIAGKTVGAKLGTYSRATKAEKTAQNKVVLSLASDPTVVGWQDAYAKLSVPERIAFHLKARLPLKKDVSAWKLILEDSNQPAAKQALDLINKPEVQKLHNESNPKLDKAMEMWRGISDLRQNILLEHGAIDPFQIQEGQYRHAMIVRGNRPLTRSKAYNMLRSLDAQLKKNDRQSRALFRTGAAAPKPVREAAKNVKEQIAAGRAAAEAELPPNQKLKWKRLVANTDAKFEKAQSARADWRAHFDQGIYTPADLKKLHSLHRKMEVAYNAVETALDAEHGLATLSHRSIELGGKGVAQAIQGKREALLGLQAQYRDLLDGRRELQAQREQIETLRQRIPKSNIGPLVGGPTAEEIAAEYKAAGVEPPGFVPDVPAKRKDEYITTGEGSIGPPRPQADVYPTTGVMFRHGVIDLVGDHVTASFFRAAKHARQYALHQWAMSIGLKIEKGGNLPDGYEWVKEYRGQRIPFSQTAQAEHIRSTNPFDALNEDEFDQITSQHWQEAALTPDKKYRVAVPKAVADQFRADFTRGTTLGAKWVRNFTNVWRSLLLKTRISWLENNVIGNTILASIRFAGVNGLRAYLNLVANMAGPKKALELLNMPVTRKGLTNEQFAQLYPEALRGSYIETNLPKTVQWLGGDTKKMKALGKAEKLGKAAFNLLPQADRWYETFLRKGAVETTLRAQPEVRAIYDAMPKGEKSWGDAMVQAVGENPHLQPLVVREMNDALGDFMSMSKLEREQIRQLVPFYAWFREITKITAKTLVDTPGRAKLLQLISQVGAEVSPTGVPSYLQGGYPVHVPWWLGGSRDPSQQTIISTRAMVPYSTVLDLGTAAASLLAHGQTPVSTRPVLSLLNPALAAAFNLQRPQEIAHIPFTRAAVFQPFAQTFANLPQFRVGFGPASSLYPTRSRGDQLFQQVFGNPIRTYDKAQALGRVGQ